MEPLSTQSTENIPRNSSSPEVPIQVYGMKSYTAVLSIFFLLAILLGMVWTIYNLHNTTLSRNTNIAMGSVVNQNSDPANSEDKGIEKSCQDFLPESDFKIALLSASYIWTTYSGTSTSYQEVIDNCIAYRKAKPTLVDVKQGTYQYHSDSPYPTVYFEFSAVYLSPVTDFALVLENVKDKPSSEETKHVSMPGHFNLTQKDNHYVMQFGPVGAPYKYCTLDWLLGERIKTSNSVCPSTVVTSGKYKAYLEKWGLKSNEIEVTISLN